MTGKQFKIKLIELDLTHKQAAQKLCTSLRTITNQCSATTVPTVYEYALLWLELMLTKGE